MSVVSNLVSSISPSNTLEINNKTQEMIKKGLDVINLSLGEPDFDTNAAVANEGMQAIKLGYTKYTAAQGMVELRAKIVSKLKRDNQLQYNIDEILISNGGKQALFIAFMTILQQNDEVIIPKPYWPSYPEQIKLTGAKPVLVDTDRKDNYKITTKELKNAISKNTKALLLNSPNNPTGAVYSKKELLELLKIAKEYNIFVISDEIYEKIIYDKTHVSIASLDSSYREKIIIINGFSKAFSMTGWRLGYVVAEKSIIKAMSSLQSQISGSISSISQRAGMVAYENFDESTVAEFKKRRDYVVSRLNNMPYVDSVNPEGAFYIFPNLKKIIGKNYKNVKIESIYHMCELWLEDILVSVVPGSEFGSLNNVRISFANSLNNLEKAMDRIELFLNKVQ